MMPKVAFQKIRRIAKRGSNEMLERAIQEVYLAGMEAGARALSEQLKGRIHDIQSASNGSNLDGEWGEPSGGEPSGGPGIDSNDENRDRGSPSTTPGPFSPGLSDLAD